MLLSEVRSVGSFSLDLRFKYGSPEGPTGFHFTKGHLLLALLLLLYTLN